MKDLYVLAYIDGEGNVSHYPLGLNKNVMVYEDKQEAEVFKQLFKSAVIVKVKEYEVVE